MPRATPRSGVAYTWSYRRSMVVEPYAVRMARPTAIPTIRATVTVDEATPYASRDTEIGRRVHLVVQAVDGGRAVRGEDGEADGHPDHPGNRDRRRGDAVCLARHRDRASRTPGRTGGRWWSSRTR